MHNSTSVLVSSKIDSISFILSVGPKNTPLLFVKLKNGGLPTQGK